MCLACLKWNSILLYFNKINSLKENFKEYLYQIKSASNTSFSSTYYETSNARPLNNIFEVQAQAKVSTKKAIKTNYPAHTGLIQHIFHTDSHRLSRR